MYFNLYLQFELYYKVDITKELDVGFKQIYRGKKTFV